MRESLRKVGMRHEGTLRAHVLKWGQFYDLEVYGRLASDAEHSPTTT
jgi:RimJ/RimL family protein N-acetyltransferase